MPQFVAQIAPQRSTQYVKLADSLAPHELRLSPLGPQMSETRWLTLGNQNYLHFDLPADPSQEQAHELGMLATTRAFFRYYERLGQVDGPFLRPIETRFQPTLPPELLYTRRYRGKTNEMFTHFLCNLARFSSHTRATRPWDRLRVFDPLAGGGTTLFAGLVLGASVAGVEQNAKSVESTAAFVKQFMRERGIVCQEKRERLKGVGKRWLFAIGKEEAQQCILSVGDTADSQALTSGFRPHLIVADLPYGIQHHGELVSLLTRSLPVWASLLPPSGAMVLAWESKRFPRPDMIELVRSVSDLIALNAPPYDALAHRVDRVIKQRDVLVACPAQLHDRQLKE